MAIITAREGPGRRPNVYAGLPFVLLAAIMVVVGTLGLSRMFGQSSGMSAAPPSRPAFAGAPVAGLPSDGGVYHLREQVFRRHGAAAIEIASWSGLGALPETYIRESWTLVDGDGRLLAARSEVRDLEGTLLQTGRLEQDGLLIRDVRSGEELRSSAPAQFEIVPGLSEVAAETLDLYEQAHQAGDMAFARVSTVDGPVLLVFSERIAPPAPATVVVETNEGSTTEPATTVPYFGDLSIAHGEKRVAFDEATLTPHHQETRLFAADGQSVILESTHWLAWETLPASTWDEAGSLEGGD